MHRLVDITGYRSGYPLHVIDDNVFAVQLEAHELSPAVGKAAPLTRDRIYADSPALDAPMLLSLIHISEPTRPRFGSRMPSSA